MSVLPMSYKLYESKTTVGHFVHVLYVLNSGFGSFDSLANRIMFILFFFESENHLLVYESSICLLIALIIHYDTNL